MDLMRFIRSLPSPPSTLISPGYLSHLILAERVVALQRDAYEGLASGEAPRYSLQAALAGTLRGPSKFSEKVPVFGVPPTRRWQSPSCMALLRRIGDGVVE